MLGLCQAVGHPAGVPRAALWCAGNPLPHTPLQRECGAEPEGPSRWSGQGPDTAAQAAGWRVWHWGAREPEEDAVCPVSQRVCLGLDIRERTGLVYASVVIFAELFMLSPT